MKKKSYFFILLTIIGLVNLYFHLNNKDEWINKIVNLKCDYYEIDKRHLSKITDDKLKLFNNEFKVVSIVDVTCMKCIFTNLNKSSEIFERLKNDFDSLGIYYVLNYKIKDSISFIKNILPKIKTKGTLLIDDNYNFERSNQLFTKDVKRRTFLIDKNNCIRVVGNPIYNRALINDYKNTILDLIDN